MGYLLKTKGGQYITRPITHPATDAQVRSQLQALAEEGVLTTQASPNAKITAHRGYHATAKQNTVAAYLAAAEEGFRWVEVDIHTTADGVLVMGHNTTVTMYNQGTAVSVTFPSANYSAIKDYTWDDAGVYPLATLAQTLNAMKRCRMTVVLDLKTGSNEAVLREVVQAGMEEHVYLSFTSVDGALSWADTLNRHKSVGVRVIPTDYAKLCTLAGTISNPILADVNATMVSSSDSWRTYLSNAVSAGVPILMSGCTMSNKAIWCILSAGMMANDDDNISYSDFLAAITQECVAASLTVSQTTLSVAAGSSATLTAAGSADAPMGYVYAYAFDPAVASVAQQTFGSQASVRVDAVKAGTTTLRLFTGGGTYTDVPVTVS